MARPWLRLYRSIVSSPKVQRLKPETFKAWVNLLCCTNDEGELPDIEDLAFMLRLSEAKTSELMAELTKSGLLDQRDGSVFMHDWMAHQFQSDGDSYNSEKQRRYRQKKQREGNELRNADGNALPNPGNAGGNALRNGYDAVTKVLPPRADTDTDTELANASSARATKTDFEKVVEALGGFERVRRWQNLKTVVANWLVDHDLDADILPAIRDVMAKKNGDLPGSAAYFTPAIREAKERRLSGRPLPKNRESPPAPLVEIGEWKRRMPVWWRKKIWDRRQPPEGWGPAPGEPGCLVPPELLIETPATH